MHPHPCFEACNQAHLAPPRPLYSLKSSCYPASGAYLFCLTLNPLGLPRLLYSTLYQRNSIPQPYSSHYNLLLLPVRSNLLHLTPEQCAASTISRPRDDPSIGNSFCYVLQLSSLQLDCTSLLAQLSVTRPIHIVQTGPALLRPSAAASNGTFGLEIRPISRERLAWHG